MISIIICSRDINILNTVSQSIEDTIGVPHEIIGIDNSSGRYGICAAYNEGAAQSRYDILCFMHEDLKFHTLDWGQEVVRLLADPTIGVLGVAGGTYQMKAPAPWWVPGPSYQRMQVLHAPPGVAPVLDLANPQQQSIADVAVLDGLWLCSRKAVWQQYPFDEQGFPGFHFYDVDYCTAIFAHYRVCVTFSILIEHFSRGSISEVWLTNALKYQQKWADMLPFGVVSLSWPEAREMERRALLDFIARLLPTRLSNRLIREQLWRLLAYSLFNREALGMVKRFITNRYLKW